MSDTRGPVPRAVQARALLPDPKLVSDKRGRPAWIHHTSMLYVVDPGEGEGEGEGGAGEGRRGGEGLGGSPGLGQGGGQAAGVGVLGAVPIQDDTEQQAGGQRRMGVTPQEAAKHVGEQEQQQQRQRMVRGAIQGGGVVPGLPGNTNVEVRQEGGLPYGGRRKRREASTTAAAAAAGAPPPLTSQIHASTIVADGGGSGGDSVFSALLPPSLLAQPLVEVGSAGWFASQDKEHQALQQQQQQQQERQGHGLTAGMDVDTGGATAAALGVLGAAAAALAALDPRDPRRRQLRRSVEQNAVAAFLGAVARGDLQVRHSSVCVCCAWTGGLVHGRCCVDGTRWRPSSGAEAAREDVYVWGVYLCAVCVGGRGETCR